MLIRVKMGDPFLIVEFEQNGEDVELADQITRNFEELGV